MKERIFLDQDGVLADLIRVWVDRYNSAYDDCLKISDIAVWDWHCYTKQNCGKKIYDLIRDPELFDNLPVIKGSQEVVEKLCNRYDVYVCTAARNAEIIPAKSRWLRRHFPMIKKDKHVFATDKSICRGEYLLDDAPHNLEVFDGKRLLFNASHNQSKENDKLFHRMNNWDDVSNYFGV